MKNFLYRVLIFCSLPLIAEEELRVELATKTELSPLYLCQIQADQSSFNSLYLAELRKILQFDLGHSGYSKIIEIDNALEKALHHNELNSTFNPHKWTKTHISYVLKGMIAEKKLSLHAFKVGEKTLKKFDEIPLTGDLSIDRKAIHQLSNAILHHFFDVDGVADLSLLYSIQIENPNPNIDDWKAEIWECDWDGGNAKQVTHEENYSITPVFIPAHPTFGRDKFLYVSYKNGQPKIYISSLKNRTGKPLLELRGNQLLPAISKKRDALAFISDAAGRADLFIQAIDENGMLLGKPQQLFSYPRSTQASPTFSPDGKKIAFVSDKDGTPRIYIIPAMIENNKRAKPILITKQNRENTCPNWSPDGTKLAYSAKTNGVRQIWIYDLEAEEEQQLTTGPGNKENPCWAPNSLHLVFNSTDPGTSDLYLVNLNQPDAVKITQGLDKKHYPTWETK